MFTIYSMIFTVTRPIWFAEKGRGGGGGDKVGIQTHRLGCDLVVSDKYQMQLGLPSIIPQYKLKDVVAPDT